MNGARRRGRGRGRGRGRRVSARVVTHAAREGATDIGEDGDAADAAPSPAAGGAQRTAEAGAGSMSDGSSGDDPAGLAAASTVDEDAAVDVDVDSGGGADSDSETSEEFEAVPDVAAGDEDGSATAGGAGGVGGVDSAGDAPRRRASSSRRVDDAAEGGSATADSDDDSIVAEAETSVYTDRKPSVVQVSEWIAAEPAVAFDHASNTATLPDIFKGNHAVPGVVSARMEREGVEGMALGETRVVTTNDGKTVRETYILVDRPHRYAYEMTDRALQRLARAPPPASHAHAAQSTRPSTRS